MDRDKILHFLACETIVLVVAIIGLLAGLGVWSAPLGFLVSMCAGVCKELHDRKTTGFDRMDIAADFLGAFAGLVFSGLFFALC